MTDVKTATRCGYVAIVGRPNVGKSTLLNHLLGQKISITSRKPQTTRHQITGIKTSDHTQVVFVDTPGIHQQQPKALNRIMNKSAVTALRHVDLVLFVVDGLKWNPGDQYVLDQLQQVKAPIILVVNKIDTLADKAELLPHLQWLQQQHAGFEAFVPISALRNTQLSELEQEITSRMPAGEFFFPEDQITDRTSRFLVAEIVREKLMRQLGKEIPYDCSVEVEQFEWEPNLWQISCVILVDKSSQKRIVIGDKGDRLRKVGTEARVDIEKMMEAKVMLNLWVKVRSGWSDDERALRSLGYDLGDK